MATLKNTLIDDTGFLGIPSGTTAERPSSPSAGYTRWNTTEGYMEIYDGTDWRQLSLVNPFSASGGTITTYVSGSDTYTIHAFTSSGTFSITGDNNIDILLVGGGGAGAAAGAGAGGVVLDENITITTGTYTITVGAGGASQLAYGASADSPNHGGNTSTNIPSSSIANGGMGAYGWDIQPSTTMNVWGSGAGIGQSSTFGYVLSGYTIGQGNPGGQDGSNAAPYPSGGGGGAGTAGGTGGGNYSGTGGAGRDMSSYFGTAYGELGWFGGGGAGANHTNPLNNATGGQGGGGDYTVGNFTGRSGQVNTGGGGSGGANPSFENIAAGAGGTGIVLIRYKN